MGKSEIPLTASHPEIAKSADGWDPEKVTAGSGKKLSWKCKLGHTWITTPGHRVRGQGCPYCSGKKVLKGFNDLATTHPKIAADADGWDPSSYLAGSHKSVDWRCSKKHKWKVAIQFRTRGGTGCPVCVGKSVSIGENDLETTNPEIAKEAYKWDPRTVTKSSAKKMDWKCSQGHIYTAVIYSRTGSNPTGCPVCANRKVVAGFNDLLTTHPEIAKSAYGWDPATVSSGMGRKKFKWICTNGHIFEAHIYNRTKGIGCGVCSNSQIQKGVNDLATTHPKLAKEAVGWDPSNFTAGSQLRKKWICKEGHEFICSISNRANKSVGCRICSNREVLPGFNDLATSHPNLAKQAYGWDPSKFTAESHKKMTWKCSRGHTWEALVNSRSRGRGCPICSNQKTVSGMNDLASTHPAIAAQAIGWDPTSVNAGSHLKKNWICPLGHIWDAAINTRMRESGGGCPFCSNHRLLVGFNDLATTHPEILSEINGWDPTKYMAGSAVKKSWRCSEGHIWSTSIGARTGSKKSGCPTCAKYGYDINKEGYLYFLSHPQWMMYQIGITNDPKTRLQKHRKLGWEVLELRGPMDGLIAQEWETEMLRYLKINGANLGPREVAGKFDGYSEAWLKTDYEMKSLSQLMDLIRDSGR